jgi:alcohol dehydrogenase class IV
MPVLTFLAPALIAQGASSHIRRVLADRGITRPFVCTDAGVVAAGLLDRIRERIGSAFPLTVFDAVPGNPTGESVLEAARCFRDARCDALVALGGGSVMDHAKGVAALIGSGAARVAELSLTRRPAAALTSAPPWVAIPTTAGTGSEMSPTAVILEDGAKCVIGGRALLPAMALCDPDLTASAPPRLTAATAMDALAHCIEAVLAPADNPPAELVALDGIRRIVRERAAIRACADPADVDARLQLLLASCEGALAFTKGLGAVHSLSHACGAQLGGCLHHGTLNAILLPVVFSYNAPARTSAAAEVARAMGVPSAHDVPRALASLIADLGLPCSLREIGLDESLADRVAELAQQDICAATNPLPLDVASHRELFIRALERFA